MNGSYPFLLLAGTQTGFFSQFADQPVVEKEINSLEKQSLNNASLSGGNSDLTKEAREKLSGAKNGSGTNQAGQRDAHTQMSQIETEKTRQDHLNQNNSSAKEHSGSGDDGHRDHPLKEELDEAVKAEAKGNKEHVDKVEITGNDEKGDKEKRNSAEAGKSDTQQTTTGNKNDPQSRENRGAGTSQTQCRRPGAGAAETPGQPTPEQQRAASKPGLLKEKVW